MNKISDFKTRLAEVLEERNLRAIWLSRESEISKGTISQYLKGVYEPKRDQLNRIAQVLEVTPEWLEGYDTVKYAGESPELVCRIPVYRLSALRSPARHEVCDPKYKDCFYAEADDHLYPAVNMGDLVLVENVERLDNGQVGLISFKDIRGLFIYKLCSDGVELCCLNAFYPPVHVRGDELADLEVLGRVVLSMRKW